jgi:hypothetical protein
MRRVRRAIVVRGQPARVGMADSHPVANGDTIGPPDGPIGFGSGGGGNWRSESGVRVGRPRREATHVRIRAWRSHRRGS